MTQDPQRASASLAARGNRDVHRSSTAVVPFAALIRRVGNRLGDDCFRAARHAAAWVLAFVIVAAMSFGTRLALAQPADIAGWEEPTETAQEHIQLPPPPDDYRQRTVGEVQWVYPRGAATEMATLSALVAEAWKELEEDLGLDVVDSMEIRLARNPEEMRALAPARAPPPAYAAGVAYPAFGWILLTLTAPDTWERPDLETTLVHELSHIALRRAVPSSPLPQWFVEGVAIHQSGERSLERTKRLWEGHFSGSMIPFAQLDKSFPSKPHEVNLAYAEAADVVRYLRRDSLDERKFRDLIGELSEGESFEEALSDAYAITPGVLEDDWLASVAERARMLPLIAGGGTFWVLGAFLLVAAWRRRKHQSKEKLKAMEVQETEEREAIERLESVAEARLQELARTNGDGFVLYVASSPTPREPGLPTVEHDGSQHTLH